MFRLPICEPSRLTLVACICLYIQRQISTRRFDEPKHCCIGVIEENVHIKYMSM